MSKHHPREAVWAQFMAAAIACQDLGDGIAEWEGRASDAAKLADYALAEYERRCVGWDESGPHFEPVYSSEPAP